MDSEELKQQKFMDKYSDVDLDGMNDIHTSWEGRATEHNISPVVLKRYYLFLYYLRCGLLLIFFILIMVIAALSVNFLLFTEHEIFVFDDGTDVSCIFNPSTGEMKQNDK